MLLIRRRAVLCVAAALATLSLAACGNAEPAPPAPTTEIGIPVSDAVEVLGPYLGDEATAFQADLDAWSCASDVEVHYVGTDDVAGTVAERVAAGDPPDIAITPDVESLLAHPDSLYPLADLGVDLETVISDEPFGPAQKGKIGADVYALPVSVQPTSLVWYDPAAFAAAGLTIPTSDAELTALEQTIVARGLGYPWCAGTPAGGTAGTVAAEWLRQYVLRFGGYFAYDEWASGNAAYDSAIVRTAAEEVAARLLAPGQVQGGGVGIETRSAQAAAQGLYASGPSAGQCFMMLGDPSSVDLLPAAVAARVEAGDLGQADFFTLPAPDTGSQAMLGTAEFAGAFSNQTTVRKVIRYLVSFRFGTNGFSAAPSFVSLHDDFQDRAYGSILQARAGAAIAAVPVFAVDAPQSDDAASAAELEALTDWFGGRLDLADALAQIDSTRG